MQVRALRKLNMVALHARHRLRSNGQGLIGRVGRRNGESKGRGERYHLGQMYASGLGVEKNLQRALVWFQTAFLMAPEYADERAPSRPVKGWHPVWVLGYGRSRWPRPN